MTPSDLAINKRIEQREQTREAQRAKSKADHALVQFGGHHVPCNVVGEDHETGKLVVVVVGCEPHEVKARLAGKVLARGRDGEKWQWQPGTIHLCDDCGDCRARRGR